MTTQGQVLSEANALGETFSSLARRYGLTKGKVAGLVRRYKIQEPPKRKRLSPDRFEYDNASRWTEESLTEKWADRKSRKLKGVCS